MILENKDNIFNKLAWNYKKDATVKECFHHQRQDCSNGIIKAHSIQKNGILSQIESEVNASKLLYSLEEWEMRGINTIVNLKPIGKSKASIFTGFCDYHDKMFSAIENQNFKYSDEQFFQYTYRGFAHSYQQAIELDKWHKYFLSNVTSIREDMINEHNRFVMEGQVYDLTVRRMNKYKNILSELVDNKNHGHINYYHRTFDYTLITTSQLLNAVYTFDNYHLNRSEDFSYLILNVIPDYDKTVVLISHFPEDYKGKILLDSLKSLNDKDFKTAISSLMIFQGLNTYLSPKLWNKMSPIMRKHLVNELNFLCHYGPTYDKFFISNIDFFAYPEID